MAPAPRRFSTLIAVLAAAAVLVPMGGAGTRAVLPTLYVEYTMNCVFTITDDNGKRVSAIPPGTYQISVFTPVVFSGIDISGLDDMTACKGSPLFVLSGPGVDTGTTLGDGDGDHDILKETFLPGSTYLARDLNQPSVARATFTTTATGSPTSPAGLPTSANTATPKATVSKDDIGSALLPLRGSLAASVTTSGKLALSLKGKHVSTLKTGRYTIVVLDETAKSAFKLQKVGKSATTLSALGFVGRRTVTVSLAKGQWTFYSTPAAKSFFVVTA